MAQLIVAGLWERAETLAKKASMRRAAVAYLTSDARVPFKRGDTLVADASDGVIKAGGTSAKLLAKLHGRGVRLYSREGLHAKVIVLGDTALVGSANLTVNSLKLVEAAVETDQPEVVGQCLFFIDELCGSKVTKRIDAAFVARALKLPVAKGFAPGKNKGAVPKIPAATAWLLGVDRLDQEKYQTEQEQAAAGKSRVAEAHRIDEDELTWLRYPRWTVFANEGRVGDSIVQIWRTSKHGPPRHVYAPTAVLERHEVRCVRFYVRERGTDGRVTWGSFANRWRAACTGVLPGKDCERRLNKANLGALRSLWKD